MSNAAAILALAKRKAPLAETLLSTGTTHSLRCFSAEGAGDDERGDDDASQSPQSMSKNSQRVWLSPSSSKWPGGAGGTDCAPQSWSTAVDELDRDTLHVVLDRIGKQVWVEGQEREGGRMQQRQLGVLREDPVEDMRLLIENYTVPSLASALRDREDVLQLCASLLAEGRLAELSETLHPYERHHVEMRRRKENTLDLTSGFDTHSLEMIRRGLMRMPRRVSHAHHRRAGVVLPLCNVNRVPCMLFEKRSAALRAHPDEVCLPGGMVSSANDRSIVATCLREMEEEIQGLDPTGVTVLGILRCNWGEVHHLTGVAVTPAVCFIGEIGNVDLEPNPEEVAECFTVPLETFLDRERWVHREDYAPIFTGGPHIIWGLTGYIVNRFVKDVMARYNVSVASSS